MTDPRARYDQLKALLTGARNLPPDARRAFLAQACAGDYDLLREAEALLAHDESLDVLHTAVFGSAAMPATRLDTTPDRVGPYEIRDVLGEGGMGTVYRAEQRAPIRRTVAVKLIRRGLDTDRIVARFRAERQALALMDHPHIARVLDAGATEDGRPYFVMELVEGTPITKYCADRTLGVRDTLELFLAVCQGVRHAHQKGIVHRDLKPSNVLIRELDGRPAPKIIDFGIAKAIAGTDDEDAQLNTRGGLMIGTPDYMSPEHAGVITVAVDTRTDVYSLGVLLYELLTGRRPYVFESYSPVEIQRVLTDSEPARPSTIAPAGIRRKLEGDLDNIILKALAKRPDDRYESVEQLVEDVRRHLDGRPVEARPATWTYRSAKFIRRHTAGVSFAAALLVLLVGVAVTLAVQAGRLAAERDRALEAERHAQEEADIARSVSDFLVELFQTSDPSEARGNSITAREILDRGAARIDSELKETPQVQAALLGTMGRVYQSLGLYSVALPLLERALERRRAVFGDGHAAVGESLDHLALLRRERSEFAAAEAMYRQALDIQRRTLGPDHASIARTMNNLANLLAQTSRIVEAEPLSRDALAMRVRLFGPEHPDVGESLHDLGVTLAGKGDLVGAEDHIRRALDLDRRLHGEVHPVVGIGWNSLGLTLKRRGDLVGAEAALRRSLEVVRKLYGDEHPDVAHASVGLGELLIDRGQLEAAEPLIRQAMDLHERLVGRDTAWPVKDLNLLGSIELRRGNYSEAERIFRRTLLLNTKLVGPESVSAALTRLDLGSALRRQGRPVEAEPLARSAGAIVAKMRGENSAAYGSYLWELASVVAARGGFEEAERLHRQALELRRTHLPPSHPAVGESLVSLGALLCDRRDPVQAEPLLQQGVDIYRSFYPAGNRMLIEAERALVHCAAAKR